jgi:hypothetical protein
MTDKRPSVQEIVELASNPNPNEIDADRDTPERLSTTTCSHCFSEFNFEIARRWFDGMDMWGECPHCGEIQRIPYHLDG